MYRVLFVCIHNSARSQMAEAFLKQKGGSNFEVMSAGLEPGILNPLVIDVMKERGIDISGNRTKGVDEMIEKKYSFTHVITVCDEASAERCPYFPGEGARSNWSFDDPSTIEGSYDEKMNKIRIIRDRIEKKIDDWLKEL